MACYDPSRRIASFFTPQGTSTAGLDKYLGLSATEEATKTKKDHFSDLDSF